MKRAQTRVILAAWMSAAALSWGQSTANKPHLPPAPAKSGGATSAAASKPEAVPASKVILAVTLPSSGEYLLLTEDPSHAGKPLAPPTSATGPKAAVELPASVKALGKITLSAIDTSNQTLAKKAVDVKSGSASVSLSKADFDRVATLPVQIQSGGKAVSTALVTLIEPDGTTLGQEQLLPGQGGIVTFKGVPAGKNTVKVTYNDDQTATQQITVDAGTPPAQRRAEVTVSDAKTTEALKAPVSAAPSAAPKKADSPSSVPNPPTPVSPLTSFISFLVGLAVVGLLLFGGYSYFRSRPEMLQNLMGKLPLPDDEPEPLRPPEPPPVNVPAGSCPFCGQAKDPVTGACACAIPVGAASGATARTAVAAPPGVGPRLVGVSGAVMGQAFPLSVGNLSLGREASNDVALTGDTTASRRHASVVRENEGFLLRDEGSSNGTFVNGARVTETSLHPGDEVIVGQARFRFESD